ncbi:MAG: hypothetical protein HOH32_14085 [Rhodobacteraceae bacterium]|nr:hypothetical protein [Paracoccaceae bacterium]
MPEQNLEGAYNLLVNCGQACAGERLLLCYEQESLDFYDRAIVEDVCACAQEIGLEVMPYVLDFDPVIDTVPAQLAAAIAAADLTVFLARLADQMRFGRFKSDQRTILSYALNSASLASPFGTVHYKASLALKQVIDAAIFGASEVVVTCKVGTYFKGKISASPDGGDVNLRRFPMLVNTPAPASGFSGRIALPGFLVGTGSKYYHPFGVTFDAPLFAVFEGNTLLGFEGQKSDEDKANQHLDMVAGRFEIDRNFVLSWHLGIHPKCYFDGVAVDQFESWSGSAFGNPRLLHVHTCGAYAPGEVCWNVVDPTLVADGVTIWEDGVLLPERVPGGREVLAEYDDLRQAFLTPDRRIGI